MKIKEYHIIGSDSLRRLCIEHNWFTLGTNEEYDKFLSSVDGKHITTNRIQKLAETIMKYSEPETYNIFELPDIMFCIGQIMRITFRWD